MKCPVKYWDEALFTSTVQQCTFVVKQYGLARYDKQTGQDPKFPLTGGVDVKIWCGPQHEGREYGPAR
jgi:hypothetical protein